MREPATVVIDDERTCRLGGTHLRTSQEAIAFLESRPLIATLFLDHDLGGDDTIRPVVEWLERQVFHGRPLTIALIAVHTANPVGADWILKSRILRNEYEMCRCDLSQFYIHDPVSSDQLCDTTEE